MALLISSLPVSLFSSSNLPGAHVLFSSLICCTRFLLFSALLFSLSYILLFSCHFLFPLQFPVSKSHHHFSSYYIPISSTLLPLIQLCVLTMSTFTSPANPNFLMRRENRFHSHVPKLAAVNMSFDVCLKYVELLSPASPNSLFHLWNQLYSNWSFF